MKCDVCGTEKKPLLTSWYCPNEDNHNVGKLRHFGFGGYAWRGETEGGFTQLIAGPSRFGDSYEVFIEREDAHGFERFEKAIIAGPEALNDWVAFLKKFSGNQKSRFGDAVRALPGKLQFPLTDHYHIGMISA